MSFICLGNSVIPNLHHILCDQIDTNWNKVCSPVPSILRSTMHNQQLKLLLPYTAHISTCRIFCQNVFICFNTIHSIKMEYSLWCFTVFCCQASARSIFHYPEDTYKMYQLHYPILAGWWNKFASLQRQPPFVDWDGEYTLWLFVRLYCVLCLTAIKCQ